MDVFSFKVKSIDLVAGLGIVLSSVSMRESIEHVHILLKRFEFFLSWALLLSWSLCVSSSVFYAGLFSFWLRSYISPYLSSISILPLETNSTSSSKKLFKDVLTFSNASNLPLSIDQNLYSSWSLIVFRDKIYVSWLNSSFVEYFSILFNISIVNSHISS